MTMSDEKTASALGKRVAPVEQISEEAQRTIDELRSRDELKTQFLSNISHVQPVSAGRRLAGTGHSQRRAED